MCAPPPEIIASLFLVYVVPLFAGLWAVFQKAGQQGWKSLIPVYNAAVLLKIVGKPVWWVIPLCLPICIIVALSSATSVNETVLVSINLLGYAFIVWTFNMLAKSFGKDERFTLGLALLYFIFLPVLGFGKAKYLGPYGNKEAFEAYDQNNRFDFENNERTS